MNTETKTCGRCIIYVPDMYGSGCSGCALQEYEGTVPPESPACGRYICRQEFLSHFTREKDGSYSFTSSEHEDNSSKAPVPRYWAKDRDYVTGRVTGLTPYCPSCNTMTFGKDCCEYCGQPFIMDDQAREYFSPPEEELRDCPFCSNKGTFHIIRNNPSGTGTGYCVSCGASTMDLPARLTKDVMIALHEIGHRISHKSSQKDIKDCPDVF